MQLSKALKCSLHFFLRFIIGFIDSFSPFEIVFISKVANDLAYAYAGHGFNLQHYQKTLSQAFWAEDCGSHNL